MVDKMMEPNFAEVLRNIIKLAYDWRSPPKSCAMEATEPFGNHCQHNNTVSFPFVSLFYVSRINPPEY